MRTKHLLTALCLFLILTVFTTRAADVVKVEKTIDGSGMNATDYPDGSLMEVTDLTLTGTWDAPQVLLLRKALKTQEKPNNAILTTVVFDADAVINDMTHLFENCKKLVNITLPTKENTSPVSFKNAFSSCWYSGKGSPVDLSAFTNISAMDSAFYNAYNVESIKMPAKVNATPMSFKYAFKANLITEIDLSGFTNITVLDNAFNGAKNLKTVKFPTAANANPIDFTQTFFGCGKLTTVDLTPFTNITNLTTAFRDCSMLTSVVFPSTPNTNEISLNSAFGGCVGLNTPVDLSIFPNITDVNALFNNCKLLPKVTFATTENARELNFLAAFAKTSITEMDLSMFPNITKLANTFSGCSKLTSVKLPSKENTLVTDISGAFESSSITAADISMFTNLEKMDRAFNSCTALKDLKLPSKENRNAISAAMAFAKCESLDTPLDLSNFTNLTMLVSTFAGSSKLPEIKLSTVKNNTELQLKQTFSGCAALTTSVDLSGFTNIIRMEETFNGCIMLRGVKMPVDAQEENAFFIKTFQDCASLTEPVDLSAFKKITDISYAFKGCASLTAALFGGIPLTLDETFEGTNPNCLKYIPESTEQLPFEWTEASNVVMSGKARADMLLEDGHPFYCPKAFELGEWKISYKRDFTGNFANKTQGWNTICLPFNATLKAEGTGVSPWGANKGYWLSELSGSISNDSIDFTEAKDILANTPYIIALPGNDIKDMTSMEGKTITFFATNISVPATPEKLSGKDIDNYAFKGTYNEMKEQPMYLIERGTKDNADQFVYNEKGNASPFRAYLTALDPEAENATSLKLGAIIPPVVIGIKDLLNEATDMKIYSSEGTLTIEVKQATTVGIYATDGRMVRKAALNEGINQICGLDAGAYIIKGNKIVISD